MRKILISIAFLALAACDHAAEDKAAVTAQAEEDADLVGTDLEKKGTDLASLTRDNLRKTSEKLREWLITPRPPKKPNNAIAASYCYHAQSDITCYRQPMPGWEGRLVAYQGTNAVAPDAAQMQPLPKREVIASVLPENKVANAKPVFTELPVSPKPEEKNSDQAPVLDSAHEQLPNPALSPQL